VTKAPRPPWWRFFAVAVLALIALAAPLDAQPDPRQMAGIPRPVTDLPNGSVSVRVIRGALTNNIPNQDVELHVGSNVLTAKTDGQGRAQFDNLTPGATVKAAATVDGERLESQEFPAPAQGGIRLLLVATAGSTGPTAEGSAPAITGSVVVGGQTRVIMEPGDETVALYYLLDIVNKTDKSVNPTTPFVFDMPAGASGTGLLQGSSARATVKGPRVTVSGPFPPGSTLVQVGCELPAASGSLDIAQRFPAAIEQFAVIVKKVGETKIASPQLAAQQEMAAEGETFIAGAGTSVAAGQPLSMTLSGVPHHSPAPRWTALSLAAGVVLVGLWATTRAPRDAGARAAERKRLIARREKLFGDLVRLERDRQHRLQNRGPGVAGVDERRYIARREEIVAALEHIYGALDADGAAPDPGNTAGVAA